MGGKDAPLGPPTAFLKLFLFNQGAVRFTAVCGMRVLRLSVHVVRDPCTLVALLLKLLLHHAPLQMMTLPVYQNLHVESSLKSADQRSELEALLQLLLRTDEAYTYIYMQARFV